MFDENSSSDEKSNFQGLLKNVSYEKNIDDSPQFQDSSSHQPQRKVRRKNYEKRISSLLDMDGTDNDKTKNIKKNCISAKQSRQRKKIYIEALEKAAEDLKKQIVGRKARIAANRDAIMAAIKLSNPQKSRFIEQYLQDNKNLAEQITKIQKKPNAEDVIKGQNQLSEKELPKQNKQNHSKNLQNMINSYLYKFGFTGVLRRDVLEQLKMKWYEIAIDQNIVMNGRHNQLKIILQRFKNCMSELQKKGLELEYLFRNLQYHLKQEDIVKFIINPEFLITAKNTMESDLSEHKMEEAFKIEQRNSE